MRIETLSIRTVTVGIVLMIGAVAVVLSLLAGSYFRQSALQAQMNSLSRVIEVAAGEMLKEARQHTFDLGMRMGYSRELVESLSDVRGQAHLAGLLDDPFINGFVGLSRINLQKIRLYDANLQYIAESSRGLEGLGRQLAAPMADLVSNRQGVERLKAADALWFSADNRPLFSMLVPVGGLRLRGYVEIVIDPVLNLEDIGKITRSPVSIYTASGEALKVSTVHDAQHSLPVRYVLPTSDGQPAFHIVVHEDVENLNREMERTQIVTTVSFLLLTLAVLLLALWMFNRFLFKPVSRMMRDMESMAYGNQSLKVDKTGLREFYVLAETFNAMAERVRMRTQELHSSQNRLLHLLDVDDSAILCFGASHDLVYFNRGACQAFGYSGDEMNDLEFPDLFSDPTDAICPSTALDSRRLQLHCIARDGGTFVCEAIIRALSAMGGSGYAVVLNLARTVQSAPEAGRAENGEPPMVAVEKSLRRILEIAHHNPGLLLGEETAGDHGADGDGKPRLREQVFRVMTSALACWERELGKTKLDLAEESGIWPVYIDKSTPTTRTLDKYLHIDTCPKNPRCQRVVDTAEFVLKQIADRPVACRQDLLDALEALRKIQSGIPHGED